MKISLGMKLQTGPWGGGNQIGHTLARFLREKGVEVYFDLKQPDLDFIVLTEPNATLQISAYSDQDIKRYILQKRWQTLVVHRINICNESKRSTGTTERMIKANTCADHTVFISQWLRDVYRQQGWPAHSPSSVILNGVDHRLFHANGHVPCRNGEKLRFVTHHWSNNWMKGFDMYSRLDTLLGEARFKEVMTFTYIGRLPEGFGFTNSTHIPPQSGEALASSLREHHIYLTAAQGEAAGMHHIEGAMCGLPLLYRESGALPEYCQGFGIGFTADNFEQKLQEMIDSYKVWVERMKDYAHTAEHMCAQYYDLFCDLLARRDEVIARRKWWHKPVWSGELFLKRVEKRFKRKL